MLNVIVYQLIITETSSISRRTKTSPFPLTINLLKNSTQLAPLPVQQFLQTLEFRRVENGRSIFVPTSKKSLNEALKSLSLLSGSSVIHHGLPFLYRFLFILLILLSLLLPLVLQVV